MEQENQEKASIGLKILSFFIPLAGLILFACNISSKPRYAKGCGIAALIGFVTSIILTVVIIMILSFGILVYNSATEVVEQNNLIAEEVKSFNSIFEGYDGKQVSGTKVRGLMSLVTFNNMRGDERQITIRYNGTKIDEEKIYKEISNKKSYEVKYKYNSKTGYINQINIKEND